MNAHFSEKCAYYGGNSIGENFNMFRDTAMHPLKTRFECNLWWSLNDNVGDRDVFFMRTMWQFEKNYQTMKIWVYFYKKNIHIENIKYRFMGIIWYSLKTLLFFVIDIYKYTPT